MNRSQVILLCTNIICLVHCLGMAVLAIFAPLLLTYIDHFAWLDYGVIALNFILANALLTTIKASLMKKVFMNLIIGGSLISAVYHYHSAFHFLVFVVAIFQLWISWDHHKKHSVKKECCDHKHH